MQMKVNVLGQDYEILHQTEADNKKLKTCDGLCETYAKKIVINDFEITQDTIENVDAYKCKNIRHEIIHAFLHESGLDSNTDWARNEEIVDWIAIQMPKIFKAMQETKCL